MVFGLSPPLQPTEIPSNYYDEKNLVTVTFIYYHNYDERKEHAVQRTPWPGPWLISGEIGLL